MPNMMIPRNLTHLALSGYAALAWLLGVSRTLDSQIYACAAILGCKGDM